MFESNANTVNLDVPVLFIFFNRGDLAARVFERISKVKPSRLYLSSDGPRNNIKGESESVIKLRDLLLSKINWSCDIHTRFGDVNLGCGLGVATAIDWFFSYEESGIVLEDDSLPSISFFYYCQDLLRKYEHDFRVWHISGTSFIPLTVVSDASYHFSKIPAVPGWATWKSRWQYFDIEMKDLDYFNQHNFINELCNNHKEKLWHNSTFVSNLLKINNGWGWQWYFTVLTNHGLAITPIRSLIKNIGLNREDAAHTRQKDAEWESVNANEIDYPLVHPKMFCIDNKLDSYIYNRFTRYYTISKLCRHYAIAFIKVIDQKFTGGKLYNKFLKQKYSL